MINEDDEVPFETLCPLKFECFKDENDDGEFEDGKYFVTMKGARKDHKQLSVLPG